MKYIEVLKKTVNEKDVVGYSISTTYPIRRLIRNNIPGQIVVYIFTSKARLDTTITTNNMSHTQFEELVKKIETELACITKEAPANQEQPASAQLPQPVADAQSASPTAGC